MKPETDLEYRMYGFVMYNISPIQQGIQFAHALQEYNNLMSLEADNLSVQELKAFETWKTYDKTVVLLNGGTSNSNKNSLGSMEKYADMLTHMNVKFAYFREPDLNNSMSAICFIIDERIFDNKKYPFFIEFLEKECGISKQKIKSAVSPTTQFSKEYDKWVDFIGGDNNVILKGILKTIRLA